MSSMMAMQFDGGGEVRRPRRFMQPGQVFVSATPATVTTILGSCIAVCLFDAQRRVGGLNHFMLPIHAGSGVSSPRFGNVAMDALFEQMRAAGARLPFIRAQVFGGACMFEKVAPGGHLGDKNAALALDDLARRGVELGTVDIGGNRGRKLVFTTDEGAACLTLI